MNKIILSNLEPVKVGDIPRLIADAIYPNLNNQEVTHLFKITTDAHGNRQREWLTDDDWANLKKMWSDLPDFNEEWSKLRLTHPNLPVFKPGLPVSDWKKYEEAYKQNSSENQNWELEAVLEDLDYHAFRSSTDRKQAEDLFHAIRLGKLIVRDGITRSPISDVSDEQLRNGTIAIEDLREYVAPIGVIIAIQSGEFDFKQIQTMESESNALGENTPPDRINGPIPGRQPRTAHSKLAIEAAWELEHEIGFRRDRSMVMKRLQKWAEDGEKPDTLLAPGADGRSVDWITAKGDVRNYDLNALGVTLKKWYESRK